ncbi:GNAT family N-acetyltransferase [Candidatus Saccharibacteria bacterium]|nr:MAG: GNAT family N-acetyltransferase [Candidatus Saccharibacteria bacterium]
MNKSQRIYLVEPTADDEAAVWAFRRACDIAPESGDIAGSCRLRRAETYGAWLHRTRQLADVNHTEPGLVRATTLLAKHHDDGRLIGIVQIRHALTPRLRAFGGHIGYSVATRERRQGFATEMLSLALAICRQNNMHNILITCEKRNIASAKVIQANGGVLENEISKGERIMQRYWITLA